MEVDSGLNGRRPKLADPTVARIVLKRRDRLGRFGAEQLQSALAAQGRRVVVADPAETTDDQVRDVVEMLTWLCVRLHGRRGARNRALRALTAARRGT